MDALHPPLLQREPDARKATAPMLPEAVPLYLALMLGVAVAAVATAWNAALVGRWLHASVAVAVGLVGSVGCTVLLLVLVGAGATGPVASLVADVVATLIGAGLYALQRPLVRGHRLLGGGVTSAWPVIFGAFALQLVLGATARTLLNHPLLALLPGGP